MDRHKHEDMTKLYFGTIMETPVDMWKLRSTSVTSLQLLKKLLQQSWNWEAETRGNGWHQKWQSTKIAWVEYNWCKQSPWTSWGTSLRWPYTQYYTQLAQSVAGAAQSTVLTLVQKHVSQDQCNDQTGFPEHTRGVGSFATLSLRSGTKLETESRSLAPFKDKHKRKNSVLRNIFCSSCHLYAISKTWSHKLKFTILDMPWHRAGWEHQHQSWLWQCEKLSTTIWHCERDHSPPISDLI